MGTPVNEKGQFKNPYRIAIASSSDIMLSMAIIASRNLLLPTMSPLSFLAKILIPTFLVKLKAKLLGHPLFQC